MGGVKIGSGAIIGTNATVAKNIPPYTIAVGNPARVVKYRFDEETIKKFMAIKWWNWSVEKVLENLPLMNDAKKFLAKHYSPALDKVPDQNGGGYGLEKYRKGGMKVYVFISDIGAPFSLLQRILLGFCRSDFSKSILVFGTSKKTSAKEFEAIDKIVEIFNNGVGEHIIKVSFGDGENFSPYLLRQATHFITTRKMVTLECLDWLYDTDVKIISALDDGIFEGEPDFDWNLIYAK